jgi:hypothetical protein
MSSNSKKNKELSKLAKKVPLKGSVPEQREDLIRFLINLPHHNICELFEALHIAVEDLEYDSIEEKVLVDQFMTSLWVSTLRESD